VWIPSKKTKLKSTFIKSGTRNEPLDKRKLLKYLIKEYGTNKEYTAHFLNHMLSNYKDNPQYNLYMELEQRCMVVN